MWNHTVKIRLKIFIFCKLINHISDFDNWMYSGPATEYEFRVRAFTSKREGADSDPLKNATDTASPSQPIISVLNCTGKLRKIDKSLYK